MTTQENVRIAWDNVAPGYDTYVTPKNITLAVEALRRAELNAGDRLLDVAAGSGALSIPAAQLGAQVLATDISPTMVERLNERAREEGLSNLQSRVMDGHALELEDDTFDVVASQFGVMLFPDLPLGLREMTRVTRPGGRVLMITFGGPPPTIEFIGFFLRAMKAVVPGFTGIPSDAPPLPFQVAENEKLRQQMVNAGLTQVNVETITHSMEFETGKQLWDTLTTSNPIGAAMVADLTEEQKHAVLQKLDDLVRERAGSGSVARLQARINIGIGIK